VGKGGNQRKRKQPVRRPVPPARLRAERRVPTRPGFTEQDLAAGWGWGAETRIRLAREDDMTTVAALCTLADVNLEQEVTKAVSAGIAGAAIRAFARGGRDGFTRHIAEQFFQHQGSNPEVPFQHVTLVLVAEHARHGVVGAAVAYPPVAVIQQLLEYIRRTGGTAQQRTQVVLMGATGIARIKALAVREEMRGAGIGTALLHRCLQIYDDCGYMIVYGQSPDTPGLDRFYRTHGFDVLAPGAGFDAWVVFGEHVEIRPDPTERTFLWHRPPQGQQRRPVPVPRTVTTSEIHQGTTARHDDPRLPAFEVSGLVNALAKCPVDVVPLYAALAVVHQAMSGEPANACVPVCYQMAAALAHLGFDTEVMAAYVEVLQGDTTHVSLGVRGPAVIRMDYTTNGHTVLWAASFSRLVDPTIAQHPALLTTAHRGQDKHGAPLAVPVHGGRDTLLRGAIGAIRSPFQINYLVQPQHTAAFDPWLAEFGDAVEHGGLGLAHLTLDTITATGKVRDLGELPHMYPRLGALLGGHQHLPTPPKQPPASWSRLRGDSRITR
jgi:GNAT superfamily N-acetyltransferase